MVDSGVEGGGGEGVGVLAGGAFARAVGGRVGVGGVSAQRVGGASLAGAVGGRGREQVGRMARPV